jgi:hypothetical protein
MELDDLLLAREELPPSQEEQAEGDGAAGPPPASKEKGASPREAPRTSAARPLPSAATAQKHPASRGLYVFSSSPGTIIGTTPGSLASARESRGQTSTTARDRLQQSLSTAPPLR